MSHLQGKVVDKVYSDIKNINRSGLLDMPVELIDIILSYLPITKNMRLISKSFSNNLTICRHIFTTFTLWPRVDCYKALDLIVHNLNLSSFVQKIRISNLPRLWQYESIKHWADSRLGEDLSDPSIHSLWMNHTNWVDAETHFWEDGVVPRLNLQLLENLQVVEMARAYHLKKETNDGRMIHRREEETQSSHNARSWCDRYRYYKNYHFAKFGRGSLSNLTKLKKLAVHKLQELMDVCEPFELPRLEFLDIHTETLTVLTDFDNYVYDHFAPAPWLLSLNHLTTLRLTQCMLRIDESCSDLFYPDVITLIKDVEFPNLREVRFETITITSNALCRFLLYTNGKHIKVLSILSPALPDRSWSNLRRILEKKVPKYESLELSDAYSYGMRNQVEQDYLYKHHFQYAPPARRRPWE